MKYDDARILVFCKAPIAGEVKTRLIPLLDADGARALYEDLASRMLKTCVTADLAPVQLWCTPDTTHDFFSRFNTSLHQQLGDDLGQRMYRALSTALAETGIQRAILIGTDCPTIDGTYLTRALDALQDHDVVLGPAEDGGYGLIGLRNIDASYFSGIAWSTDQVCAETCRRFNSADANWALLPLIWDVDRAEDVSRYRRLPSL